MRARANTPLKQALAVDGRRQDWLAERVGATKQQVWTWVHGLHVPAEPTRRAIACALGREVDELFPVDEPEALAA